jgi:hypothetical protein
MMDEFSILDHALNYAEEWKWAVFPCYSVDRISLKCSCGRLDCKNPGKHPRTKNGSLNASLDTVAVESMFLGCDFDNSNIGIATGSISNLIVVDVDEGKGGNWRDLLIGDVNEMALKTPRVKTGAGLHFYYKLPPGQVIKNSASVLAPHIDIRGEGGYVIAPPSRHFSGKNYEWIQR